jgi:glycosyltransferase involved in cell wall biosynthesis
VTQCNSDTDWVVSPVADPLVTVAVPSLNQGRFLEAALESILSQGIAVEVFVADGGSCDSSLDVLRRFAPYLAGWRSRPDAGQAAAINECIALGRAPYVAWLNSDDLYLPGGLAALVDALARQPDIPAAYGRARNIDADGRPLRWVRTEPFNPSRLARRCIVAQPASLVRREIWSALGGLDTRLDMAFDYDLWWRIYRQSGPLGCVDQAIACNRDHAQTKTRNRRARHYAEAIAVVRRHHGQVPPRWWLAWPYSVWWRGAIAWLRSPWIQQGRSEPRPGPKSPSPPR